MSTYSAQPAPHRPTSDQARRGLFIDFEGNKDREPSLLGSYWIDGGRPRFKQYVMEPRFWLLAEMGLRPTMHAQALMPCNFSEALQGLAYRAQSENRLLFAWSSREIKAIQRYLHDPELVAWYEANLVNVLKLAKSWKRRVHPGVVWKRRDRFNPVHSLERYQKLCCYLVPAVHRTGRTGKRLQRLRARLAAGHPLTARLKGHWTKLLNHNFHDCRGMREVSLWIFGIREGGNLGGASGAAVVKPRA
jgi:hypothetical protein